MSSGLSPHQRRRIGRVAGLALAIILAGAATSAAPPAVPIPAGAESTGTRTADPGSHDLAVGPWQDGVLPVQHVEGRVSLGTWKMMAERRGTLALLQPLRADLVAAGWEILFECDTAACGGFDFRYALDTLPEPAMHVDLGDFRFLAARHGHGPAAHHLGLLISRSAIADTGHLQIVTITPSAAPPATITVPADLPTAAHTAIPDQDTIARALENGALILDGVEFSTGAADLATGGDTILAALAAYLTAHPQRAIALVGHTDAAGSLEVNTALSLRRAQAVRQRLIAEFGVDPLRLTALGAGYMAPRASNLTDDGRAANRRVEAILTSTR